MRNKNSGDAGDVNLTFKKKLGSKQHDTRS